MPAYQVLLRSMVTHRLLQFLSPSKKNEKKRSHHPESMKKSHHKRFADRVRALCDDKHLAEELQNIEDVFVANGYPRETVRRFMEPRPQQTDKRSKKNKRTVES